MITFRPASLVDQEWLYALKRDTLKPHVEQTWGKWDEADQAQRFAAGFDPTVIQIIQHSGHDVGVLSVVPHPAHLFLADILLRPEAQGRGFGTQVIGHVINQARAAGKPVRLQVLKVNPAQQLYLRLGFRITGETATHRLMFRQVP